MVVEDAGMAEARIRRALHAMVPMAADGDVPGREAGPGDRPAAVLIALVWHADGPTVLLTRRTEDLPTHAGQVSFPGGKVEPGDADSVATALREAQEETGLDPAAVRVLGVLPDYVTITRFVVTPVVAMLSPGFALSPDPAEVADVFELPLSLALDLSAYRRHAYERDGVRGEYHALEYGPWRVWGATAAMLRMLARALSR